MDSEYYGRLEGVLDRAHMALHTAAKRGLPLHCEASAIRTAGGRGCAVLPGGVLADLGLCSTRRALLRETDASSEGPGGPSFGIPRPDAGMCCGSASAPTRRRNGTVLQPTRRTPCFIAVGRRVGTCRVSCKLVEPSLAMSLPGNGFCVERGNGQLSFVLALRPRGGTIRSSRAL